MQEKTKIPEQFVKHTPWERSETPIWLSSQFILRRNYSRYPFPPKISDIGANQILDLVKNQLEKSPLLQEPQFLKADELNPTDREYLFEHFLTIDSFGPLQKGQGFIIDNSQNFLASINMNDHLMLKCIEPSKTWEKTWEKMMQLETELGNILEYAYSPKFGYLTSDPAYCGTGLTAQAFLHLPAILQLNKAEEAFMNEIEPEIFPRNMGKIDEPFVGDIVVLQNKYTLGLTEDAILHALYLSASKLMTAEETLQKHIQNTNDSMIKDKISRAFGLLFHSYQLQTQEVLSALSHLKLGVQLGWVTTLTNQKINEIFFKCQRAHLLFSKDETISQDELPHKRAEFLHQELKNVTLKI